MTLVLTRTDLLGVLDTEQCLGLLRQGFVQATDAEVGQRVVATLPFGGTATTLIPGVLPGLPAYTVKVNAKFPRSNPALRGLVCLHSGTDGELLAVLDSGTVTAWRTGLAAALATDVLATCDGPEDAVVGVVGAGAQAELMLMGLAHLRTWKALRVHDSEPHRATAFAARHAGRVDHSARAVAASCDIVLLATWARSPLLYLADTRPGQHLTSLGADEPGKQELGTDLLEAARTVVDNVELAVTSGALSACSNAFVGAPSPAQGGAETLGGLLRSGQPIRSDSTQRTVYAPVGLPWQDLVVAWTAYQTAVRVGAGTHVDWLA